MSCRWRKDENLSIKTGHNYMINEEQVSAYVVLHRREQKMGRKALCCAKVRAALNRP
jgi:hypothetical protein